MNNIYKDTVIKMIEKTSNPGTPIALHNLFQGAQQTARCIASSCNEELVKKYSARLLKDFPDKELDDPKVTASFEFLLALLALVSVTIEDLKKI